MVVGQDRQTSCNPCDSDGEWTSVTCVWFHCQRAYGFRYEVHHWGSQWYVHVTLWSMVCTCNIVKNVNDCYDNYEGSCSIKEVHVHDNLAPMWVVY